MIVEEGTRAEQLAKQQRNLKQRYKGNLVMLSIHHGIAGASSVLQRCRLVVLLNLCSPLLCRLGLKGKMEDLMDTSELISDADILPSIPSAAKPAGKGAPELLSSMSGLYSIRP